MSERLRARVLHADWPAPPGVHALVTLRGGEGDATTLELPSVPAWLQQVHGTTVAVEPGSDERPEADASVTRTAGKVLAIRTADCLPVVFAARDGSEVAAAHAGWRGLAAGVLEATIAAMQAAPRDIVAWMGPAAGPGAYEVGADVRDAFVARDAGAAAAFASTRPGHWRVDLYALARRRMVVSGMRADAIHGGGLCTISDPSRFHSYRRDRTTERMVTLAWRQAEASAAR